jgi:diguanylate cyclase
VRVSRYQQSAEQSAELLRLILPQIGKHGSNFNPCSYALWYEHLAGINASLSLALQSRLRSGTAMSSAEVLQLYEQHVQSQEVGTLLRLQAGLGDLLRKLGEIAAQSGDETNRYYEALVAHQEQLLHVVEPRTL